MNPTFDAFGPNAVFHHIGLVVRKITDVIPNAEIITDPVQKVRLSFVQLNGVSMELLEPLGPDSPVYRGLEQGNKLAHICFSVPDIRQAIINGKAYGFTCIAQPVMAIAFNRKIAWVFHAHYGLIELLEF